MIVVIGITGYTGRMGKALTEVCQGHPNACLVGGVTRTQMVPSSGKDGDLIVTDNPQELFSKCDLIIDFSHPSVTPIYAHLAAAAGKPFLTGTTGITDDTINLLQDLSSQIPVLHTNNTSLSLVVTSHITALAAALLRNHDFDISILDKHHKWKQDAPSGTALALGDAAMMGNERQIKPTYASIRTGNLIGEHEVMFAGKGETITIAHNVTDRRVFARGAIAAALWLAQQPAGYYAMDDMLKL